MKKIGLLIFVALLGTALLIGCNSNKKGNEKEELSVNMNNNVEKGGIILVKWDGTGFKEETIEDFEKFINESDKPVFVDFWAEWCPPCVKSGPFVESLAKEFNEKAYIIKVDVDTDYGDEISRANLVQGLPTFIVINNKEEVDRMVGYDDSLNSLISEMIDKQIK